VQDGTAEDLYRHPRSAFVAQFIGRTNLLSGMVAAQGEAGLEVQIAGQRLRLPAPAKRLGPAVRLVLRPEAIRVEDADTAAGFPGTIVSRTFLGEKVEYRVRLGEQVLQVVGYNPGKVFAEGQPVRVVLPTTDVPVLEEERA
jgi:ABC-type Fe3+/spermidine/putrescine transport system ATPase subunit